MSQRDWKSSTRRRVSDAASVKTLKSARSLKSANTSSSSSTVSVSNKTENNKPSLLPILTPSDDQASVSAQSQTEGFAIPSSNGSVFSNSSESYLEQGKGSGPNKSSHSGSEYFNSNSSVMSGFSTTSSVDTYSFAFDLSSSKNSMAAKRTRSKVSGTSSISPMPTLEEINDMPADTSFLDSFLASDSESEASISSDKFGDAAKYIRKGKLFAYNTAHTLRGLMLKFSDARQSPPRHVEYNGNKYNKQKSTAYVSAATWLWSALKFLLFLSLVTTVVMALSLASKDQPDLLAPGAPKTLKQRIFRRKKLPGVRPGQLRHSANESNNVVSPTSLLSQNVDNSANGFNPQYKEHQDQKSYKHIGARIPAPFLNLADIDESPTQEGQDLPFYWHIPRTGGTMMNDVLGTCLNLKLASDAGGRNGHDKDEVSHVFECRKYILHESCK